MNSRFYTPTQPIDLEHLVNDVENIFRQQGFQTQRLGHTDNLVIQLKKGGDLEAIVGMQAAVSISFQHTAGGLAVIAGQQKWVDKVAVGAVGLLAAPVLWPLVLTAGAGAIRQVNLSNQALNIIDSLIRQQQPDIKTEPTPAQPF
jgi:hypothetical protein